MNEEERAKRWKTSKKAELQTRITKLASKIVLITNEIQSLAPAVVRRGIKKVGFKYSSKFSKHWYKMAKRSLMAHRKKIYRLQHELRVLDL